MSDLGMKLSKVLFTEEPKLLICDVGASVRSASAVANLLGCILATVLTKHGEEAYVQALKAVSHRIHDSAMGTASKAELMSPNTTSQ
jgi:hypothetical protein